MTTTRRRCRWGAPWLFDGVDDDHHQWRKKEIRKKTPDEDLHLTRWRSDQLNDFWPLVYKQVGRAAAGRVRVRLGGALLLCRSSSKNTAAAARIGDTETRLKAGEMDTIGVGNAF